MLADLSSDGAFQIRLHKSDLQRNIQRTKRKIKLSTNWLRHVSHPLFDKCLHLPLIADDLATDCVSAVLCMSVFIHTFTFSHLLFYFSQRSNWIVVFQAKWNFHFLILPHILIVYRFDLLRLLSVRARKRWNLPLFSYIK